MEVLTTFFIAFFFSFIGTIPPGVINLTILQLGLDNKINTAWRFAIACSMIEYPYAWIAIKFQDLISTSPVVVNNLQLIAAIVMIALGIANIWAAARPSNLYQRFNKSGFRRGLLLGVLNPQALPFWVGVTAYVKSQHWVLLTTTTTIQAYLFGVCFGAIALLMSLAYLANKMVAYFQNPRLLKKIPGYALLALGIYAFVQYLF